MFIWVDSVIHPRTTRGRYPPINIPIAQLSEGDKQTYSTVDSHTYSMYKLNLLYIWDPHQSVRVCHCQLNHTEPWTELSLIRHWAVGWRNPVFHKCETHPSVVCAADAGSDHCTINNCPLLLKTFGSDRWACAYTHTHNTHTTHNTHDTQPLFSYRSHYSIKH